MRITTRSVAKSTLVAIMTAFAALILGVTQIADDGRHRVPRVDRSAAR